MVAFEFKKGKNMEQKKKFYEELYNQYLKGFVDYDPEHLTDAALEELTEFALKNAAKTAGKKEVIKDDVDNIKKKASKYGIEINFDAAINEANTRLDFDKALTKVVKGRELSSTLHYAFNDEDLSELAKLHKAGKHREKIFELLEDCNFHIENADFDNGNYCNYIKEEEVCVSH